MKRKTTLVRVVLGLTGLLLLSASASLCFAIEPERSQSLEREQREDYVSRHYREPLVVDVWTNKGDGAVYSPGERIRVYFRASADCYVTLYNVDTEGYVHVLYPARSLDQHFIQGGMTYRIPARRDPYDLVISGPSGIEYIEAVASAAPFHQELPWYLDPEYSEWGNDESPWTVFDDEYEYYNDDYDYDAEIGIVRGDPYLGIQRINRRVIPEGYPTTDYATAVTSFYVSARVAYPRYLCYDCHWHNPHFDPYGPGCIVFDMRIDRTWVYSPRIYVPDYRPKYYYGVKDTAPVVYKNKRHFWSSRDGLGTLKKEFSVARPNVDRPGVKPLPETWRPKAGPGGEIRWQKESGPADLKTWKSGQVPPQREKLESLKQKLQSRGLLKPRAREEAPAQKQGAFEERKRETPRPSVMPTQEERARAQQPAEKPKTTKQTEEKAKAKAKAKVKDSTKTKTKADESKQQTQEQSTKKKGTVFGGH
jgi:hypothetical protein